MFDSTKERKLFDKEGKPELMNNELITAREIDGCEYIVVRTPGGVESITHKGNCVHCAIKVQRERLEQETAANSRADSIIRNIRSSGGRCE